MTQLRLGFMCPHNPHNRNSFSGTPYYMMKALQARRDVDMRITGGHHPLPKTPLGRIVRRLRGEGGGFVFRPSEYAELDAVVALAASHLVAAHAGEIAAPVYLVTDTTPAFLREFYNRPVAADKEVIEVRALSAARGVVYSSSYMVERACREFPELTPERAHVLPFGVNLDTLPAHCPVKSAPDPLRLLFIGRDWARKGGDLVIGVLDALRAQGRDARLTVIGAASPEAKAHAHVEVLGYLDKNVPEDAARFMRALEEAHLLVLPTRADCTPMVVAEVNSYGCPVLISDVGGVSSLMAPDGGNGRMLSLEADARDWARAADALTADAVAYAALSRSSYDHAMTRLTWSAWSEGLVLLIRRELV